MPLDSSPSINEYKDGIPPKYSSSSRRKKRLWIFIGCLAALVLVLGTVNFLQSDVGAIVVNTGTVAGTVVDENGKPVEAQIYILSTSVKGIANSEGYFQIDSVPAGNQAVVVAYRGSGFEYPANIRAGEITDLGEVRFVSTLEPHE
ncbi:MAG: carboxypeptidase-like regulatory domain-containing protein [Chloroflexota bacterium]|nr:carboxypeptidase-like regulatory domain-containing protein [Chloroflexota bacterium]